MGKLLQKLVHGLVPSWLTKVKSANPSPRAKSLPFFKPTGATQSLNSNKPASSSSTSLAPSHNMSTGVLPLVHDDEITQQEDESSSIATSRLRSSSYMPTQASEAEKVDRNILHQHEESRHNSLHVKDYNHQHTSDQRKQDNDTLLQSRSGRCTADLDAVGLHVSSEETLKSQKELQQYIQEGIHQRHGSHETEFLSSGYSESAYKLLGCKRKSGSSLQGEEVDDDDEEEEEELGGSGSDDIKVRWAWKRRKGEKGILSCELPESICSIVGNGRAVVKQSLEPQLALWESMVEMIVGNGLHEMGNLEFLLYCYLSLNEPHLYPLIQASFLQVLKDLERIA